MTGFIRGIFNRKSASTETNAPQPKPVKAQKQDNTFFLDPDDAKSFGDIDYMRTVKTIKRTFPKTVNNQANAPRIEQVSALESIRDNGVSASSTPDYMSNTPTRSPAPTPSPQLNRAEADSRRSTDTSMDMFRNMAREMKR